MGHAERSIWPENSSETRGSAAAIIASTRSTERTRSPCCTLPASIGPPETKIAGILRRSAAISIPGVILSQLEMQTRASAQWAFTMYSTLSAISSREGRLYSIPPCPMAMPSSTAIVLNSLATPPACFDLAGDQLSEILQMDVSGHELREGIGHGDDRFVEVPVLHSGGAPQAARAGHVAAVSGGTRAINRHFSSALTKLTRH